MATANNNNTNTKPATKPAAPDLGQEIAAAMAAAFAQLAQTKAPQRRSATADVNPWAGVQVTKWSNRERDAMQRLGWFQLGWSESRPHAGQRLPETGSRPGPEMPDAKRVARGEIDPTGFQAWNALAMVCARLAVYGRIGVEHAALIFHTMGASPAQVGYLESPSRLATKLQQVLRCRVLKSADGSFIAQPGGRQAMHDALAQAADRIITGK